VQQNVDPMIPLRGQPPKTSLDSKRGIYQWAILRGRFQREPNLSPSIWYCQQPVLRDINIIVPDESSSPCRLIGQNCEQRQQRQQQPIPLPPTFCCGRQGNDMAR